MADNKETVENKIDMVKKILGKFIPNVEFDVSFVNDEPGIVHIAPKNQISNDKKQIVRNTLKSISVAQAIISELSTGEDELSIDFLRQMNQALEQDKKSQSDSPMMKFLNALQNFSMVNPVLQEDLNKFLEQIGRTRVGSNLEFYLTQDNNSDQYVIYFYNYDMNSFNNDVNELVELNRYISKKYGIDIYDTAHPDTVIYGPSTLAAVMSPASAPDAPPPPVTMAYQAKQDQKNAPDKGDSKLTADSSQNEKDKHKPSGEKPAGGKPV